MAVTDCAFQQDAFQNNAFQVCIPVPAPTTIVEARRWPGPSYTIYREGMIPYWQHRREEDEIIIL